MHKQFFWPSMYSRLFHFFFQWEKQKCRLCQHCFTFHSVTALIDIRYFRWTCTIEHLFHWHGYPALRDSGVIYGCKLSSWLTVCFLSFSFNRPCVSSGCNTIRLLTHSQPGLKDNRRLWIERLGDDWSWISLYYWWN